MLLTGQTEALLLPVFRLIDSSPDYFLHQVLWVGSVYTVCILYGSVCHHKKTIYVTSMNTTSISLRVLSGNDKHFRFNVPLRSRRRRCSPPLEEEEEEEEKKGSCATFAGNLVAGVCGLLQSKFYRLELTQKISFEFYFSESEKKQHEAESQAELRVARETSEF